MSSRTVELCYSEAVPSENYIYVYKQVQGIFKVFGMTYFIYAEITKL